MEKQRAIELAGSVKALAALFKITPAAISQWGDTVPEGREWQLRVIKPEWFAAPKGKGKKDRPGNTVTANDGNKPTAG